MIQLKDFSQFINEASDQLDISIKAVGKFITSDKKRLEFLSTPVKVEHKTDGIKITLVYINDTGDYTKDWIVSYKGEIQYPGEFDFTTVTNIKKSSIANSQFQIIFNHLKKITPSLSGVKKDTELFVEFLMKKPTLSSTYTKSHGMVLIAQSPCTYTAEFGKLKTASTFNTNGREELAKKIKLDVPAVLFEGVLGNQVSFEKSIIMKELKSLYASSKGAFVWDNPEMLIENLRDLFLEVDSVYGGKEEGVVIKYLNGSNIYLKFQQEYQVDKASRDAIKMKYKEEDETDELQYWKNIRLVALEVISIVAPDMLVAPDKFEEFLGRAAKELKRVKLDFKHSKRNETMIKDDIQGNIKMIARKRLKGNNGALILGRFQPFTSGHQKMVDQAVSKADTITICIVRARKEDLDKNPFPYDLQVKMISAIYPKAEIITHSTGNLFGIMGKSNKNVNQVWCGTDRFYDYKDMLARNPDISVHEIKRSGDDISATKVREAIRKDDEKTFKKLTPKAIHKFYKELRDIIS